LGDSVAAGFGLPGYRAAPQGGNVTLLYEMLKAEGFVDRYENLAVSGHTTGDLLGVLDGIGGDGLKMFAEARVVSINIGGNNILEPFMAHISGLGTQNPISGLLGLASLVGGSFPPALDAALDEGVGRYGEELGRAIDWLKEHAPDAVIIVNTVYHSIPKEIMGISVGAVATRADGLIDRMNGVIYALSEEKGFLVADVYGQMSGRVDLTISNFDTGAGAISFDVVHPNADGHRLIAEIKYGVIYQFYTLG
jgi:lysophospholipase L1-like esterase